MEQFVRDSRISMIYEGANGIQALDLVARKLPKDGGRAITAFFAEVSTFLAQNKEDAELAPYLGGLKAAAGQLQQATMWLMQNAIGNPDNAGAGSNDYMHLFGLTLLGFMWARIAKTALARMAKGDADEALEAKLVLAKFFNERMMPEAGAHLARLTSGAGAIMAMPAAAF
jgi:acyl-CoA dehydrogenase